MDFKIRVYRAINEKKFCKNDIDIKKLHEYFKTKNDKIELLSGLTVNNVEVCSGDILKKKVEINGVNEEIYREVYFSNGSFGCDGISLYDFLYVKISDLNNMPVIAGDIYNNSDLLS